MILELGQHHTFPCGKHTGKPIHWIIKHDPDYLLWASKEYERFKRDYKLLPYVLKMAEQSSKVVKTHPEDRGVDRRNRSAGEGMSLGELLKQAMESNNE